MLIADAIVAHLAALSLANLAPSTVETRAVLLRGFTRWCAERDLRACSELTAEHAAAYRAHLADAAVGLSLRVQRNRLVALRALSAWIYTQCHTTTDIAAGVLLPRLAPSLPRSALSLREAEHVLRRPRLDTPLGERDRAIIELLFSSGLRRAELLALDLRDLDLDCHLLRVRRGKGGRERLAPLGRRAVYWLRRYLGGARLSLLRDASVTALFVGARGTRVTRARLNERLRRYLDEANVGKRGSCHVWRHTMATVMHDRGADIRDLQVLLGHAQLSTTALYTHVSPERLLRVHRRTHPSWRAPDYTGDTCPELHPMLPRRPAPQRGYVPSIRASRAAEVSSPITASLASSPTR